MRQIVTVAFVAALCGCRADEPSSPPTQLAAPTEAAMASLLAEDAKWHASEEFDRRVSAQIPEYAGALLEDGVLVIRLTKLGREREAADALIAVRRTLGDSNVVRALGNRTIRAGEPAEFSYAQLSTWRAVFSPVAFGAPGLVYLDLNEFDNRLEIAVQSEQRKGELEEQAKAFGIPARALEVKVLGPTRFTTCETFLAHCRPLAGGTAFRAYPSGECSLAFAGFRPIPSPGVKFVLTAGHCAGIDHYSDGYDGFQYDSVYHAVFNPLPRVGPEIFDRQGTSCGFYPSFYFCRHADIAAYRVDSNPGQPHPWVLGRVMRGETAGDNDTPGSPNAHPTYPFFTSLGPIYSSLWGTYVYKVGRSSYMTAGIVTQTCVDVVVGIMKIVCSDKASFLVLPGDSGGAVLQATQTENQVYLAGVVWGWNHDEDRAYFSNMNQVFSEYNGWFY